MIYIETPRLLLRDWQEGDIEPFARMNCNPQVMKYFLKPLTADESLDFYYRIQTEFLEYGYGLYAMERSDTGDFIGYTGFHNIPFNVDFAPGVEIGWRIRYEDWNKGYATEAATACVKYAKYHLPFTTIYSFTSVPNKASERIMQKIGMENAGTFLHPVVPDGHPLKEHILYKITV